MSPEKLKRRDSRRLAMIALYSMECTGYTLLQTTQMMAHLKDDWAELPEFTTRLSRTCADHMQEIDSKLIEVLENWKLDRVAPVERAILKLGCCEIEYFEDIPPRVTINEYIELAKLYADNNAPAFVNGILDKLVKLKHKPDVQKQK